jgi:acyl-coenzyme A synthetase/AMP-(fatty) acid ligase
VIPRYSWWAEGLRNGQISYHKAGVIQKGKVHLIDRAKNMIKVRGLKMASVELEKMIAGLPKVANCTVTESGFSLWEPPLIFLVPTDSELSETDIEQDTLCSTAYDNYPDG